MLPVKTGSQSAIIRIEFEVKSVIQIWTVGSDHAAMPGQCYFQDAWLIHADYKDWLEKGGSRSSARRRVCRKEFSLKTLGVSAVSSHGKGSKHVKGGCHFSIMNDLLGIRITCHRSQVKKFEMWVMPANASRPNQQSGGWGGGGSPAHRLHVARGTSSSQGVHPVQALFHIWA